MRHKITRVGSNAAISFHSFSDAPRRVGEAVNESFGSIVPAFQASILFVVCNHALTRVATACRRFAPRFLAHPAKAQGCQ